MKKLDTYMNLCTQVYDLSKPKPPTDTYEFYKSFVIESSGAILEPMCGTGRFLLPLLKDGFKIDGFDANGHMLKALHEKAKELKLKPNVWQSYAEDIDTKNTYNLIFIPSGSFGLIIDTKAANESLKIFYAFLEDGGTLVFETETLKATPNQFGASQSSVYRLSDDEFIIATFLDLPPKENIVTTVCKYELMQNNKLTKTETEKIKVKFYDPETLNNQLKNIGFSEVIMHKAFDRNTPPGQNDKVVIYECKK